MSYLDGFIKRGIAVIIVIVLLFLLFGKVHSSQPTVTMTTVPSLSDYCSNPDNLDDEVCQP